MSVTSFPQRGRFQPFAVDRILVDQLPSSLGTIEAPERYTVTAVFTRRPLPQEIALLQAPAVAQQLIDAGYSRVTLSTTDRRLMIGNTNLHELKVGLARLIGRILEDIGNRVEVTGSAQARDAAEIATRAAERTEQVLMEASEIDFSPRVSHYT